MSAELIPVTTKQQAAAETGLDESKIHTVAFELDYLRRNGLLVDVSVTGVGMFSRSAQLGELGIDNSDVKAKRYTAGSKFLIPKTAIDQLRSVEARMRQAHVKFTTDVAGFRPYRWLPYTGYKAYKARFEQLKSEFGSVKSYILANLDNYRDMLADEFAAGARHTWAAIEGQGYTSMIVNGRAYLDKWEFIDAVVNSALAQFPTAEKIQAELNADYQVGVIYTDYDQEKVALASQMAYSKAKLENELANLKVTQAQEEFNHTLRMNRLEQQEKEAAIEAMMMAEMQHAKSQLEAIRAPFEEVFITLRSQVAVACDEIKDSLDKNGFLKGKVAERAAGLVELYDLLAAHNDKELREKLVDLRARIGGIGEDRGEDEPARSPEAIRKTLTDIINMANLEAEELSHLSRAAFLEV